MTKTDRERLRRVILKRSKITEVDMAMVEAPWTAEQVDSLNGFQKSDFWHPFTGNRKSDGEKVDLIATPEGWVHELGGTVIQKWAYHFMINRLWEID